MQVRKHADGVYVITTPEHREEAIEALANYWHQNGRGSHSPERMRELVKRDLMGIARKDGRVEYWNHG